MIRFAIYSSFILVLLVSVIGILLAFTNYTITLDATKTTISNISEVVRTVDENIQKQNLSNDSISYSENALILNEVDRVLDKMENAKSSTFNSNTLSFLFTIFSFLFLSIGIFLYNKTDEKLHKLSENLKLENWTANTNSFVGYLMTLQAITLNSESDGYVSVRNAIADSRQMLDDIFQCFNIIKYRKIGISAEQHNLCLDLIDRIDRQYEGLKQRRDITEITYNQIEVFQDLLFTIKEELENSDYVKIWEHSLG